MNTDEQSKVIGMLDDLAAQNAVSIERDQRRTTRAYVVRNKLDKAVVGEVVVIDTDEVAYCAVAGMTNEKYAKGESLVKDDIERFVSAVLNDRPEIRKGWFGRTRIMLYPSGLTFTSRLDTRQ